MIKQTEPYVGQEELSNLKKVIENNWLTEGPFAAQFINKIKQKTRAKHVLLAPNGTLAIYLALRALGITIGDEVIVPDFTFNATASPIEFLDATPVFVDVKRGTLNMDPEKLSEAITPRTKAIVPVHIFGQCADMDEIMKISLENRLPVLEDAAQAYGVSYGDKHAGTIGDAGIISFFADKTVTCGEGAVILTNNDELFEEMKFIRNQGRESSGTFIHERLGMNFRMTDLQCAVGVAQLDKFPIIWFRKSGNYKEIDRRLDKSVERLEMDKNSSFVPFRMPIRVDNKYTVMENLKKSGVETRGFFYPLHKQPCFGWTQDTLPDSKYPVSVDAYNRGICLPVHTGLSHQDIDVICNAVNEAL